MSTKLAVPKETSKAKKPVTFEKLIDGKTVTVVEDLDPPYTSPQEVKPVEGAAYGLGIVHLTDGLTFVFERWTGLRADDECRVYANGTFLGGHTVTPLEVTDQRFFVTIPRGNVELGFVPNVYGEVIRIGPGTPSTSTPQTVFIKDTRPGGIDERPDQLWHSNLILTLSDTFIDAGVAARGVTATIKAWVNMRVNDVQIFFWGGYQYPLPPITEAQVGNDLVFTITPDFIEAAGSGNFVVQFYLLDEVRNRSGEEHPWCKPVPVVVDLDLLLLPEPEIVEADPVTLVVDVDLLGRNAATASVFVARTDPNFQAGDFIRMVVQGTTDDGELVRLTLREPMIRGYNDFSIRNDFVRSLLRSTMTAFYVRERAGVDDLRSRTTTVTIAGMFYDLPRPSVREAHGPFVAPDLERITVEMPDYQPPGDPGDTLDVNFIGYHVDGSVERYPTSRLAGSHPRTRDFSNAEYTPFEGLRDTNVYYVVSGDIGVRESDRRYVQIGRPARDLPAPTIHEALKGNIDPTTVGSTGTLELPTDFKLGDIVIVKYTGSVTGDSLYTYRLSQDAAPLLVDIPRQLILDNIDGTLTVSYVRDRGDIHQISEELLVTIGTALGELFLPEVTQATTEPDELDPARTSDGATVRCRYEFIKRNDVVVVHWRGLPGAGSYQTEVRDQVGNFIDVTVPPEVIGFNLHPLGRRIEVSFTVSRNGFSTDSPILSLHLLPPFNQKAAYIESIGESAVMQVDLLHDLDRIIVDQWDYGHEGQRAWLMLSGTFNDDRPYDEEIFRGRLVSAQEAANGVSSFAPVSRLRLLKDLTELEVLFGVTYNRSDNAADIVWFNPRHYLVQLESNTFPHPEIQESTPPSGPDVSIDPIAVQHRCQVLVSYPDMNKGGTDQITLHWFNADGSTEDFGPLDGLDGGTVTFNIPTDVVAASVNSTIHLQYTVELGRGGTGFSDEQAVRVDTIGEVDLPRLLINHEPHGGSLNPQALSADAMASTAKWPLSLEGQRVWASVTTSSPGIDPLILLENHRLTAIQQANGLANIRVSRAWLLSVPDGARITVHLRVTYNRSENPAGAVTFPNTEYAIRLVNPLNIQQTSIYHAVWVYRLAGYPSVFPAVTTGNTTQLIVSGGTGPYNYSSDNSNVASVTTGGAVSSRGNGVTTIRVTDSSSPPQVRTISAVITNVIWVHYLGIGTEEQMFYAGDGRNLLLPNLDESRVIQESYAGRWPMPNGYYWTRTLQRTEHGIRFYWTRNLAVGTTAFFANVVTNRFNAVGLDYSLRSS